MYQPLQELLERRPEKWTESDIRRAIEVYLRKVCKTERLYCDDVAAGVATVRVGSQTLNQSVRLLLPDVVSYLKQEAAYELKSIKVVAR